MQRAAHLDQTDPTVRELAAALPLYAASLVVTLTGIGGVGVTINSGTWLPLWALLAVIGHGVSLALRYARVPAETVFYPVMLLGSVVVLQQMLTGGTIGGLELTAAGQSIDMVTASLVGSLAVIRTFTLVTNSSLLFSPVPAITMLALVGSANLNAEVPVFFGLFLLSSLFITGYEAHLRRMASRGREAAPVLFHLLTSWGMALGVAGVALLFPVLLQPVLGQFSPFSLPGMNRVRPLPNLTQPSHQRATVGSGPITLSPVPVYDVYTSEPGRLRTAVFSTYSGRDWRPGMLEAPVEVSSSTTITVVPPSDATALASYSHWLFPFTLEPAPPGVAERKVQQKILTRANNSQGIPGLGQITEVRYPYSSLQRHLSGTVSGTAHVSSGRTLEVTSIIREPSPDQLRHAPRVRAEELIDAEALELPQTTHRVQELARRITAGQSNDYDRVQSILGYIEKNCAYTLQEEVTPAGEDAADYYLFHTKRGACDLAATAATIMCRSVGIPARVAVGYVMEEPLEQGGGFLVRQEHAHMWSEAYFTGYGWIPFDAAPPIASIKDHPLQVLWYQMTSLLTKIGGGGLDALLAILVVAGTTLLLLSWIFNQARSRLRRSNRMRKLIEASPAAAIAFTYERALTVLKRRGWSREPWMTAAEFLTQIRTEWKASPEAAKALERLTYLFERAHYGDVASPEELRLANEALREVQRTAPSRRRVRAPHPRSAPAPAA